MVRDPDAEIKELAKEKFAMMQKINPPGKPLILPSLDEQKK